MNDTNQPLDLGLLQEQSTRSNLPKLNQLGKLYDQRESKGSHLRWGVKSRELNLPTYFQSLRESLTVKRKGRLI